MASTGPKGLNQRNERLRAVWAILFALTLVTCPPDDFVLALPSYRRPHPESSYSNPNPDDSEAVIQTNLPESSGGLSDAGPSQTQRRQSLGIQSTNGTTSPPADHSVPQREVNFPERSDAGPSQTQRRQSLGIQLSTNGTTSPPADHSVPQREVNFPERSGVFLILYRLESTPAGLPVYITQQMERQPPNRGSSLGFDNIVTGLIFQVVIGYIGLVFVVNPPHQPDGTHHLQIFGMIMLLAFAFSFCGAVLRRAYPRLRGGHFIEQMGVLSTAIGFYLLAGIFLPNNLTWICWVAAACSFIVFILALARE